MNNLKLLIAISSWLLCLPNVLSQGIKIGETGTSPHPDAILELESNSKGLLLPRLTTAERNAMSSPVQGLQIFNLDTDCIEVFFGNGGWKATDCGCTSFPDASFANPGGSANIPVNFSANTIVGTNTYNWTFDQGTPNTSTNTTESVTWTTAGTYPVTLSVTDDNNCAASTSQNVVIVPCSSFPDATFTGSNGSINSPIAFSANGTGPGYTYAWSFPSGTPSTSSSQNPTVEWATAGTFTVELTVTDNLGCSATETMVVTISLCTPEIWNFTNCGQTGRFGPTQAQCNTAYASSNLNGQVTINTQGVQEWTVPVTGTYRITAAGAQGSSGSGGAVFTSDFTLTIGTNINILVGQMGISASSGSRFGGGGGSFVEIPSLSDWHVAGGGSGDPASANRGGLTTQSGTGGGLFGGSVGCGGGGLLGNGLGSNNCFGLSYANGGTGGYTGSTTNAMGGFGGGGGTNTTSNPRWGGGGGYTGGNGGFDNTNNPSNPSSPGTGGGSYSDGMLVNAIPNNNTGHGYVTIEKICP
jgi:PKD repeat protein